MSENNGSRATTKNSTTSAAVGTPSTDGPGRLTVAQVLPTIFFPLIGSLLYIVGGMPASDIIWFLAGCGGTGTAVTVTVSGGRRAAAALTRGLVAAAGK
ncbi:hypothetical protein [Streptomyces pseudogriseolus]|uniref:hypothetical protein n=1 Tax=Streptomyces pseudogriseolus TaxID=36817 RepID=UPI003FA2C7DB